MSARTIRDREQIMILITKLDTVISGGYRKEIRMNLWRSGYTDSGFM